MVRFTVSGVYDTTGSFFFAAARSMTPRASPTAIAVFALVAKNSASIATQSGEYVVMSAVSLVNTTRSLWSVGRVLSVSMQPYAIGVSLLLSSYIIAQPTRANPGSIPMIVIARRV